MRTTLGKLAAVTGFALTALTLTGSIRAAAESTQALVPDPLVASSIRTATSAGLQFVAADKLIEAHTEFLRAAGIARDHGLVAKAAEAYSNAGAAAMRRMDSRDAVADYQQARKMAEAAGDRHILAVVANNLAIMYLSLGHAETALAVAREGVRQSAGITDRSVRPKLEVQIAAALARLKRFPEAEVTYRGAIGQLIDLNDFQTAVRVLATLGGAAIDANELASAEAALDQALYLIRTHRLPDSPNVLRGLAKIRARQGDRRSAANLFEAAIHAPPVATTPRWLVYADRGEFRLEGGDAEGALEDFRYARQLIKVLRADIVPSDNDRINMESGLNRVPAGLVASGNELARASTGAAALKHLEETFDAAEQDRLWSLRALVPAENDWRGHLPAGYWDLLARYQTAERAYLETPSEALRQKAGALNLELEQLEAAAGGSRPADNAGDDSTSTQSVLKRVQGSLDGESVLLSFLVNERGSWVWVVDRDHAGVFPLPPSNQLATMVNEFTSKARTGSPNLTGPGHNLYNQLFGAIPAAWLHHKRWLLELDGPLFELPFAALVIETGKSGPVYLTERAALEAVPGALLLEKQSAMPHDLQLLAVGDAVYNQADERYRGERKKAASLPRLPGTRAELGQCALAWGKARTRILQGQEANLAGVQNAIAAHPAIIHFATHVVAGPDDFSSGLIALSLDGSGGPGLLGPTEIVARPVTATLVVLNGCHSTQGKTLPSAGLMGLTRAWLGAGAGAVLATRWDIPDNGSQNLMAAFYRQLGQHWQEGPAYALQAAQIELLKQPAVRANPSLLASYFLIGRV